MERLKVIYHLDTDASEVEARAGALAVEQSVEMPVSAITSSYVLEHIVGRVDGIEDFAPGIFQVTISFARATLDGTPSQLFNILLGNASLLPGVRLWDVEMDTPPLPPLYSGGVPKLRTRLGLSNRAITCSALKPQGSPPEILAQMAQNMAEGGIDLIKDDHNLAEQPGCTLRDRLAVIPKALRQTGSQARYVPHLMGSLDRVREGIKMARGEGVEAILLAPGLIGVETFFKIARENEDLIILAHPAFSGSSGINPAFLLGKFFRLLGADITIFPSFGGRFSYSSQTCRELTDFAQSPWERIPPIAVGPAGGMTLDRIPEIIGFYGRDTVLVIGGDLLRDPDQISQRAALFHGAIERACA